MTQKQRNIIWKFITGLFILLVIILTSALINHAGIVNIILNFLLLGEPFILLIAIISLSFTPESFERFRKWLIRFWLFHIALAMVQRYVLRVDLMNTGLAPPDNTQGVFFVSGGGHVVGASVSLTFALYYFLYSKSAPKWLRIIVLATSMWQLLVADAKQVLLTFFAAGLLFLLTKVKDYRKLVLYILISAVIGFIFTWCLQNLAAFSSFRVWMRPELYGPNGDAILLKTVAFRVIPRYYESPINWLIGIGPGHSVDRLGGWMLEKYKDLFGSLATIHEASSSVWSESGLFYISSRTSMFSPLFGWAGIWGNLGLLGLGSYFYIALIAWRDVCIDDFSKFILLTVFVTGCIFSQMEEPGYMLTVASIFGLNWQQKYNRALQSLDYSKTLVNEV
jgi:hypothetical protein